MGIDRAAAQQSDKFGIVVIGRNEGERLRRCLDSVVLVTKWIVYVDSGSTDASVPMAASMGVIVANLDMDKPFTAARARNEGAQVLRSHAPHLLYIQFVDGDCEISTDWLQTAVEFLETHQKVAAVFGRLYERHPSESVYNMLCDIEWDTPVGRTNSCGGIVMMRIHAFESIHGFRSDFIAGEEPELCVRLRNAGWQIWRINADMGLHDAGIKYFSQWWKRTLRGGYAYALGLHLHGATPERHGVRESRSAWFWGLIAPLFIATLIVFAGPMAIASLLIYPIQIIRIARQGHRTGRENWLYASFLVLGKFAEMCGQMKFLFDRLSRKHSNIIEYK